MNVFLRIDINIAALILLGLATSFARNRLDKEDPLNRSYLRTSALILILLTIETLTCIINRQPYSWLIPVTYFLHVCLFAASPLLTYYWFVFVRSIVMPDEPFSPKLAPVIILPVIVNAVITVLSPWLGLIFTIDGANVYHRGVLFYLSSAIIYSYLFAGMVLTLARRERVMRQEFLPLFVFSILPMVGGLVQTFVYGPLLMWSSAAFSLLLVYFFLQERMVQLDALTGAWSRGSFDYHLTRRAELEDGRPFAVIYIDIDGLKDINDQYGHKEGDSALKTIIRVIKSCLRKSDIVARLGGDEFGILMDCPSPDFLDNAVSCIDAALTQYNSGSGKQYRLQCSLGADIFHANMGTIDEFMHHIDTLMYRNKKIKKAGSSRI